MIKKVCRWCSEDFTFQNRKSKVSCSDECAYEFKKQDTIYKNGLKRQKLHLANQDDILKRVYEKEGNKIFDSSILIANDFDWSLSCGELVIETFNTTILKNYAYALFKNETVMIWKM